MNPDNNQQSTVPNNTKMPHRVGVITFGIALVCIGILFLVGAYVGYQKLYVLLKFSPIILIVLGVEILIASYKYPGDRLKFDGMTSFFSIMLVACCLIFSIVGPAIERTFTYHEQEDYLQTQYMSAADEVLYNISDISNYDAYLILPYQDLPDQLDQIGPAYGNISIGLSDSLNQEDFVKTASNILSIIQNSDLIKYTSSVYFYNANGSYGDLSVRGLASADISSAALMQKMNT